MALGPAKALADAVDTLCATLVSGEALRLSSEGVRKWVYGAVEWVADAILVAAGHAGEQVRVAGGPGGGTAWYATA